ncbi:hypothetical protein PFICI_06829 [Pestalotiopsis fici W106-1]|uniref:Uncharacterized protein n=1 Tax=Pestalotiopsis fici (strain W106-1 / CGMCC3.15140) TaxID=1229662 RepID=W3X8W0_PESFW|nr:uncharacterized protein PFICI_06829 [Pestalotiopsis fici W106-1]ETS81827.1 hypothetical protein PFICI_06829 [Pestalotiopsis fici W106-1]
MEYQYTSSRSSGSSRHSSTSPASSRDAYYQEFRSSTGKDYKKTVVSRGGVTVHQENARGYNSAEPHPPYRSYGSSSSSRH